MPAYIRELRDKNQDVVYPATTAKAVFMGESSHTVEDVINDMRDGNSKITFPVEGGVRIELGSGHVTTVSFNEDGSITETTATEAGAVEQVKITRFNSDGSITINVEDMKGEQLHVLD